jgi:hypothetical protein
LFQALGAIVPRLGRSHSFDPPPRQDEPVSVNDERLTRSDGLLRLIELHLDSPVHPSGQGRRRLVTITDFYVHGTLGKIRRWDKKVHIIRRYIAFEKLFLGPDPEGVRLRFETRDVEFALGVNSDSLSLPDGIVDQTSVFAELSSRPVEDRPRLKEGVRFTELLPENFGVTSLIHETDVLALFLVPDRKFEVLGLLTGRRLGEASEGKERTFEHRRLQAPEHITLILVRIFPTLEKGSLTALDLDPTRAHVVAGGDPGIAVFFGPGQQRAKLDVGVALNTRVRSASPAILRSEIVHDPGAEEFFHVEDGVGNSQAVGNGMGVSHPFQSATSLALLALFAVTKQLEGDTSDVPALVDESRGRDGAIDPTTHSHKDFSLGSRKLIRTY